MVIEDRNFMPLAYYKKEPFTGSFKGMRYRIESMKNEEGKLTDLKVTAWPQPFSFECTDEEKMKSASFPFNEEGRAQIREWLDNEYEENRAVYEAAM